MRFIGLLIFLILILVFTVFSAPKCDYCHGILFDDYIPVGKHFIHTNCYKVIVQSMPIGHKHHVLLPTTFSKDGLNYDGWCTICGEYVKTYATRGEMDYWVIKNLKK